MTKIRLTFLLLALALLLPLALLVRGAFQSVGKERELRHQAIAERIFDEMERELTTFLRREEARSLEQYALLASGRVEGVDEPFIEGYFQIHADGSVDTWPETSRSLTVGLLKSLSQEGEGNQAAERFREQTAIEQQMLTQRPGTTVAIKSKDKAHNVALQEDRKEGESDAFYSSESVLRQLNRGAYARKSESTPSNEPDANSSAEDARSVEALGGDSKQNSVDELFANTEQPGWEKRAGERSARRLGETTDGRGGALVPPMTARLLGNGHIFLWRTVVDVGATYRQGLVFRVSGLFEWLNTRVIESSELTGHAWLLPESGRDAEELLSGEEGALVYRYQFDEPFTDVAGLLSLDPLPASGGASYLQWLSALVVLVSTLGLFALYRMVAVAVGFAERQQNFVSAVTHELKTPLTAIRLYGEMLRDGLVPDEAKRRQYFGVITAESERLTRLVNNVLELAKLQRKKQGVSLIAGPIEPVLREVVDTLEPHARNEGFEIRIHVPPDLPHARYDRDALQQVFFNLIDNAIKYAKTGAKRLILVEAEERDGGVSVTVVDHGPGVSERHIRKVFEPFFRGESELTDVGPPRAPASAWPWSEDSSSRWEARSSARTWRAVDSKSGCPSR